MNQKSQTASQNLLIATVAFCAIPSCFEAFVIAWGQYHGHTGKALRDGLDFWAGGFLALHGHVPVLFNHIAYQGFLDGLYGRLPYHLWSYPPNYLLLASGFGWLSPWHAALAFDAASLLFLAFVLRLAGKSWWFIAAVIASPASLENLCQHQNAALTTALIGGGLLLLATRPRVGGMLIGLATIKPQLGLVLPLYLLRRAPLAMAYAALAAITLATASLASFGPGAWVGFWHFTTPMMSNVLLTGQPPDFAGGLISVFALARPLGIHAAIVIQSAATFAAALLALRLRSVPSLLLLGALASPYLHAYDLLGATLGIALLVEQRLATGFARGESVLLFLGWFGPGLLPWMPQFNHAVPLFLLLLLLASSARRGGLAPCDSSQAPPGLPASSVGRSPIPAPPASTASG